MARKINRLSARTVQTRRAPGYYPDGAGLYLQVSPSGTKSWIFRYMLSGKAREMGLGSAAIFSLEEARKLRDTQRKALAEGLDPIEARKGARVRTALEFANSKTFKECAAAFIAAHRGGWTNPKHAAQWKSTLATYAEPVIGEIFVKDIDTHLVHRVLQPLWDTKRETATRLRGRIERVLDWARVMGYRPQNLDNPARWKGHLDKILPTAGQKRDQQPALPFAQIGEFVNEVRARPGGASQALEFMILTALRTFPVVTAEPHEFDLEEALWTIPARKMKGRGDVRRDHRVPLSPRALEIMRDRFKEIGPNGKWIFPGLKAGRPMSNAAMAAVVDRMNEPKVKWIDPKQGNRPVVPHGFRSAFKDWASETTSYPNEISEMALAHSIGSKTEEAYRRGDLLEKRRNLMNDWARYCSAPKTGAEVVPISRKKA